jgi:hypothetical protein
MAAKSSGVNAEPLDVAEDGRCAGTSTLLWRMIRLLGQNAGLLNNAFAVAMPGAAALLPDW